jgi:hypothetical protein
MQDLRKHYFPANDETVFTGLCPNGQFGAYLDREDGRVRGYGHTRLAAIADLSDSISNTEEDEQANAAAFQIDHERDLRKHGGL